MTLDKVLQHQILKTLNSRPFEYFKPEDVADNPDIQTNLLYLYRQELIDGTRKGGGSDGFHVVKITAAGVDYIDPESGVGAELRTLTIRIDPDDLRALMAARVEKSNLPGDQKSRLVQSIHSLPERALQELTTRLVNEAVDQLPGVARLIQNCIGS